MANSKRILIHEGFEGNGGIVLYNIKVADDTLPRIHTIRVVIFTYCNPDQPPSVEVWVSLSSDEVVMGKVNLELLVDSDVLDINWFESSVKAGSFFHNKDPNLVRGGDQIKPAIKDALESWAKRLAGEN